MIWLLANWRLVAGAAFIIAILGIGWGLHHSGYKAGREACENEHRIAEQEARDRQAIEIAKLDRKHTQEMEDARIENEKLRAAVRDGTRRLSIRIVPKPSATPGLGDAETRSDIDPRDAEWLISIANRGDDAIRQLSGCQDYIRAVRGE